MTEQIKKPHVLAVPFPAQGHVKPLLKLSQQLAKQGIKVTFVNIEEIHKKIVIASDSQEEDHDENLVLASVPDGLSPEDDRNNGFKILESLKISMIHSLKQLIEKNNSSNSDEKFVCMIADVTLGYVLEIAEEMGIKPVAFVPFSAASLALTLHISKLVENGEVDINGTLTKCETVRLSENIPPWKNNEMLWSSPADLKAQKTFFECSLTAEKASKQAKWLLCNSFSELESAAFDLNPNIIGIGPLRNPDPSESVIFRHEDSSCLTWLDEKPVASVIYVSFGSVAVFSQHQLDELAFGLQLSGRPFLWVVRSDLANGSPVAFPKEFLDRVGGGVGKIVEWAPQENVLSHPSVACFLSHCGWNSTIEGLSGGLPFLCWPYFADQFHNQSYIYDEWKIGLRVEPSEDGIRTRYEIMRKIEMLLSDDNAKGNALKLKAMAEKSIGERGSFSKNLERLIKHIKE